jgi:predicted DNA-binding transcriptional regulator AlpA
MEQTAKIIRLPQVRALVGLGKTTIYDKIKQGHFPKPLKLGRVSGWLEGDVRHGSTSRCRRSTGYTRLKGYPLVRIDTDPNASKPKQSGVAGIDTGGKQDIFGLAEQVPKSKFKADKSTGVITMDAITRIEGVPPEAWEYQLGSRSALEWVMSEYADFTPKDPTIREKFNLYRFADHKEDVIALLGKVCRVSIETVALKKEMRESGEV